MDTMHYGQLTLGRTRFTIGGGWVAGGGSLVQANVDDGPMRNTLVWCGAYDGRAQLVLHSRSHYQLTDAPLTNELTCCGDWLAREEGRPTSATPE